MIYCLQILDFRFVKFGYSSQDAVDSRLKQMQTGSPFELIPVFVKPGTLMQEQELHLTLKSAFARCAIPTPPNEWYPGRCTLITHALNMITQPGGSINHAITKLDEWNPAVNQGGLERQEVGYDANIRWPKISDRKWGDMFGEYNNNKKPKSKRFYQKTGRRVDRIR